MAKKWEEEEESTEDNELEYTYDEDEEFLKEEREWESERTIPCILLNVFLDR